ncbi:MAG: hypothetical protein PQJ58_20045 [Spirochaetales bacterium]|nr:hypothetical protein [Spirochaetales bacterium]
MKKAFILLLVVVFVSVSCDTRVNSNIFSALKNTDNISVLEAIASGDEEIMTAVYERESARWASLDPVTDREEFLQVTLDIADLQSVRSRGVLLFVALIVIEVSQTEVGEVIDTQIIEDYLYEVSDKIRDVRQLEGESTPTQKFMAALGLIVYWYYIADYLGTSPREMVHAYKEGNLEALLLDLEWESLQDYDSTSDIEEDLKKDVDDIQLYIQDIEDDPETENMPDLQQAVENTSLIFGV